MDGAFDVSVRHEEETEREAGTSPRGMLCHDVEARAPSWSAAQQILQSVLQAGATLRAAHLYQEVSGFRLKWRCSGVSDDQIRGVMAALEQRGDARVVRLEHIAVVAPVSVR